MIAIFNKKLLIPAALFVAGFLVINVGMFFFLKATQPKVGGRVVTQAAHAPVDSLALTAAAKTDSSAMVAPQLPSADTVTQAVSVMPVPVETTAVIPVADEITASAVDTPATEPEAEVSEAPPETSTDEVIEALQSGDSRQTAKLAKLLESMKPVEAADIASHLTTDQIVALVMKMKDRTAGRMLAALPIEQAAQVAERMSQTASRSRGG
jgi:hypothetical protein